MALNGIKQIIVRKNELGEVVEVLDIKTFREEQVQALKEQAEKNKCERIDREAKLTEKIEKLESEILKIKAELSFNRGEITEKEYEELCGLNK